MLLGVVSLLFTSCADDPIRSAGNCSIDDWVGNYVGVEVCTGPSGMPDDPINLVMDIVAEANNVIDVSWVDEFGDAVQFLAPLEDNDFCRSVSTAFPAGGPEFRIDIVTELMPDGNIVQTGSFFSEGFNFQTCVTNWTRQ